MKRNELKLSKAVMLNEDAHGYVTGIYGYVGKGIISAVLWGCTVCVYI